MAGNHVIELRLEDKAIFDLTPLKQFPNLKRLSLKNNLIRNIEPISSLTELNILDLSNNNISNIEPISELDELIEVSLSRNHISNIYPLLKLTELRCAYLSHNLIEDLEPLSWLINLKTVSLDFNRVKNLTLENNLSPIEELSLSNNIVININNIKNLKNLRLLNLSFNKISDITPLSQLTHLEELYLSRNEIDIISPLAKLTKLNTLFLSGNKLVNLEPLSQLHSLTNINLSVNQLTNISPLGSLSKLEIVNLSYNNIYNLTPIGKLQKLKSLYLKNNNIRNKRSLYPLLGLSNLVRVDINQNEVMLKLPLEEQQVGWNAIKKYLISEERNSLVEIREVKVLLLGNGNVGKSTLLHYLESGNVKKSIERTHGIQYKQLNNLLPDTNIHIWDFGGQEYFHATHKLFFSPGSLHIIMWNHLHALREDETYEQAFELDYWLRCSEQLCESDNYNIDVLVTENKIGKSAPQLIDQKALSIRYPNIALQFTSINLMNPAKRLEGFKEILKENLANLPILHEKRPDYYKVYLSYIKASIAKSKTILRISDFFDDSISDESQVKVTMRVFHLMGFILYFPEVIPDKVFISPRALLDLLYDTILDNNARLNKGKISETALKHAIKNNQLGITFKETIALLKHFDLIFQISGESLWFAPQYLPDKEQAWLDFISKYLFSFPNVKISSDSYLMNLVLLKLFSAYGKLVKKKALRASDDVDYLFWRDGLVIEKDNQVLLIKFDRASQTISLFGDKEGNNFKLQKEIIDFILLLQEDSRNLKPNVTIDSTLSDVKTHTSHELWDTEKFVINIAIREGDYVPWKKLNNSKTSIVQHNGKTFFMKDFKRFLPNNQMPMKKIFISYSKDDLKLVNEFINHLSALRKNGQVESWYCTELLPGEKWESVIQKHFDEADIICFMVSPNFMKTTYIHEYEIPRAFQRANKENPPLIVPILLDFCDWETTENNLFVYSGLPYSLKPIADFRNPNMGWYLVVEMLKIVIKDNQSIKEVDFKSRIPEFLKDTYERIKAGKVDNNS